MSGSSAKGHLVMFEELAPCDRQDGEASWLFVIHPLACLASHCVTATREPCLFSISPHGAERGPRAHEGLALSKDWDRR